MHELLNLSIKTFECFAEKRARARACVCVFCCTVVVVFLVVFFSLCNQACVSFTNALTFCVLKTDIHITNITIMGKEINSVIGTTNYFFSDL